MRQAQKKKEKDKVAIVLMLAFCIIALTSIFTVKANIDKVNKTKDVPVSENAGTEEPSDSGSQKSDAASQVSGKVPTVDSLDSEPAVSNFQFPVKHENAQVTNPYSMDKLIYSVTLDQYMTHCGVDIEAPEDTQVTASAPGTVTAIYEDDRYGTSVEITHSDGFITVYSNLSTAELVEVGDVVEAGKVIGGVGTTGLFESLEPAHLHLEMLKDGVYVNPADYIKF